MTPQPFHPFAPTLFFSVEISICMLFLCITSSLPYPYLKLSTCLCIHSSTPPPIHLDRVEECEEDSIEEEKEEEEEETPVTESDSDEQEGANETTSRYFRT